MRRFALFSMLILLSAGLSLAADPGPVRVATRLGSTPVIELPLSVIELALANAPQPRELEVVAMGGATQLRLLTMLETGTDEFDLYFAGHSKERAEQLIQLPYPLTQGLLGLRVLVVNDDQPAPSSEAALKQQWQFGSGLNWFDTDVLEHGGFNIVESDYANLWPMLERGRFDAFPRGVAEAFVELDLQAQQGRQFYVSPDWLIAYPADFFIYLNQADAELAAQLQAGYLNAQANGSLDKLYQSHPAIREARDWLNNTDYQLIWLDNPFLEGQLPNIPRRYWIPARHFNNLQ